MPFPDFSSTAEDRISLFVRHSLLASDYANLHAISWQHTFCLQRQTLSHFIHS